MKNNIFYNNDQDNDQSPQQQIEKVFRIGNKIHFQDSFNLDSVERFIRLSNELLDFNPYVFNFSINSFGGSVFEMFRMIDYCENHVFPSSHIAICSIEGVACSAAAILATFFPIRFMSKRSTLMFHELNSDFFGNYSEVKAWGESLDNSVKEVLDILEVNSFKDKNFWEEILRKNKWLTAFEAKEIGVIDGIIGIDDVEVTVQEKLTRLMDEVLEKNGETETETETENEENLDLNE